MSLYLLEQGKRFPCVQLRVEIPQAGQFQFDGKISECQTKISKIKSPNEISLNFKQQKTVQIKFFRHRRCQALKSSQSAVLVFSYIARFESLLEHF